MEWEVWCCILPRNLSSININFGQVQTFPNFVSSTPNIHSIDLEVNGIIYVPETAVVGLAALKKLSLSKNKLHAVPDLYHLPISKLYLSNNVLDCNYSLCCIQMSPWLKPSLILDDITCNSPTPLLGMRLMDIHPLELECRDGMPLFSLI